MSKDKAIQQIDMLSAIAVQHFSYLHEPHGYTKGWCMGVVFGLNTAAALLACEVGIASDPLCSSLKTKLEAAA